MSGEVRIHFVPEMRLRDLLKRGVDWVKEELKQEENSQMIQREIMEPLIQQFLQKIYP